VALTLDLLLRVLVIGVVRAARPLELDEKDAGRRVRLTQAMHLVEDQHIGAILTLKFRRKLIERDIGAEILREGQPLVDNPEIMRGRNDVPRSLSCRP
jgi:hypothetical protein